MKTNGGFTKKIALCCYTFFLLISSVSIAKAQPSESHNFITYDTTYNVGYAGLYYILRITRPANMFTAGSADTASRPAIIHMGGVGEIGSNPALTAVNGPHYWLNNGWDGGVQLGNGKHYPIIISVQSGQAWPQTREVRNLLMFILNTYHIKRNSVHLAGLSMGGMTWTGLINGQASAGDETGMKLVTSIVALQGQSNAVAGGSISPTDVAYSSDWTVFGHWAKKYNGKFFGLEGSNDYRAIWQVQQPMNDSVPGSAYFSYDLYGGGAHCCWNTMYDPNNIDWQSLPPITNPNLAQNGFYPSSMGTYVKPESIFQWMIRQGDTSMVGIIAAPNQLPASNAGADKTITLPVNTVTVNGSGTDTDGTIASYLWTKVSGPATFTIASPALATTAINNLIQGVYKFELRVTDNQGGIGRDTVMVTVNPDPNLPPTANAGADQNITLPVNTVTATGSGTDADGTIASYQWTRIAGPATYTIVSPTLATSVINNLVQGTYQFELKVTDNGGATGKDTIVVTVNAAPNQSPSANAGADQNITLPVNTVTATGSGTDPDGTIASYQWTKIAGPATFTIVSPALATTVINNLIQGTYQFELKVTDNGGATAKDTIVVTVNAAPNQSPSANAGADQNITLPVNTITATGSGTDPDGIIASYQWTKIAGPATFTIVSPTLATTVINNLIQGTYQFELKVTDNGGATAKDTIVVTVNPALNQSPSANAGADQNITLPISTVTLNGSGTDPDGTIASYQWTKIAGPATFTIVSPALATTLINALVQGSYQFELKVTDNQGATAKDTVTVTVNPVIPPPNQLPSANAGADQNITLPVNTVTVNGSGTDPDGTIASYQWTKIGGPATFTIVSPALATTVINNLVQGTYQFELKVTDDLGGIAKDTVVVTVTGAAPNQSPSANAGADKNITLPVNTVTVNGSGTDPDGIISSYQWTKIAGPATFTIVSPALATTVINNLVQGTYQFELMVTDDLGATAKDTIAVTVNAAAPPPPNQSPSANAGADQNITLPVNSVTVNGNGTDPDGTIASYQWTKIAGPATFTIASPASDTTIINNLIQGTYQFELKVTDDQGAIAKDTMVVIVNAAVPPPNQSPSANAGADQNITLPVNTVTATGSGTDPDGTIASYQWTKIAGPATFTIVSPALATTVINNLIQGTYQFELTVTDNQGATDKDTMVVIVNVPLNQSPSANAGADQNITLPVNTVTITGSGTDPDGTIASYQWFKIAGPNTFTIVSPASATTVINNLIQGTYQFELTVTDNQGATDRDTIVVIVNPAANIPPVANAGADQSINLPLNSVLLNGGGSDVDGTINTTTWSQLSGPNTATIVTAGSFTTTVSNLIQGNYSFRLTVTDNNGATGMDTVLIHVNAATSSSNYVWNSNNGNIYIDNTTFGAPLHAGDTVFIPARIGGYNWMALNSLNSGIPNGYIVIYFQPGTYFIATNNQPYQNIGTSLYGVKIYGAKLLTRPESLLRFRGNAVRYPAYIWFDNCSVVGTTLFDLDYTGGAPYNGDTTNMYHHWKITNCSFDSTYQMVGNSVAIGFGSPFNLTNNSYFRDIEIAGCTFANYPSPGGSNPSPSNYIAGCNVYNISIHNNKFRDLGVVAFPGGHTSAINLAMSKFEIYSNFFGPNIFGDDIRMAGADLPAYPAYSGLGRVYNNITYNKRKYAFIESRYIDGTQPHVVPPIVAAYVRDRTGPEVWNTTCVRMGTGQSTGTFYSGAASIYDFYRSDSIILHNSFICEIRDTTWNPNYVKAVDYALAGPYNLVDTSGNKVIQYWATAGMGDSTFFIPLTTGQIYNAGVPVPSWLTTDYYGNPRTVGGAVDVGAVERQGGNASPTANAGPDIIINLPTTTAAPNGNLSSDPDGTITTYAWTQISGTAATIVNPSSATTSITGLTTVGVRVFRLTVTDNSGATSTDDVTVTVNAAPPPNQPPVANAGGNQTITLPTNFVTLTGSGTDADGTVTAYLWTKIAGPATFTIVSPASATTVINNLIQGTYQFELRVTDNKGAFGRDTVTITVNAAIPGNQMPVAIAGPNQTITLPVNSVTVNGSGTDPDGTIATYQWTKIAGPVTFTIVSPTQASTVLDNLVQGVYQFELRVTDNQGGFGKDTVTITVNAPVVNQPPVAYAGLNQVITLPTNSVTLSGSGSDADGTIASYLWTKIAGPATYTIVSPASATTAINNLVQGVYQFELRVTDNQGATGRDTLTITVNAAAVNQPPLSYAGSDWNITLPVNSVTLTGSGTDLDGTIASYQWTKVSGPTSFMIVTPTQSQTIVNTLVQGVYKFELRVTDNQGAIGRDTVTVTVNITPPVNQPPVANAGLNQTITLPTNSVTLTGSGTDPDGTISAYQWIKVSGPATYTIVSPGTAQTSVNNLVQGVYQFELRVNDNLGASGKDTVTITVNPAAGPGPGNRPPVANAGPNQTITLPANIVSLTGSGTDPDGTIASYRWTRIAGPVNHTIVTPTQPQTSVTDLVEGTYRFELRVTDNLGAIGKDTVEILVKPAPPESTAEVFPNPVTTTANIKIKGITNASVTNLTIYDAKGAVMYHEQFVRNQPTIVKQIDVSRLVPGIYFIKVDVDINNVQTLKLIKQ